MNDYLDYLSHHGVKGQKWGQRNAEWYPIAAFNAAKGRAKSIASSIKNRSENKKRKRQQTVELKKEKKEEVAKRNFEEEKERILKSGTPGEVLRIADRLTDKELIDVTLRNRNLDSLRDLEKKRLKEISDAEFKEKYAKVDRLRKHIDKISDYVNSGVNAYNNFDRLMKVVNKVKGKTGATEEKTRAENLNKKPKVENVKKDKNTESQSQRKDNIIFDAEYKDITPNDVSTALTILGYNDRKRRR